KAGRHRRAHPHGGAGLGARRRPGLPRDRPRDRLSRRRAAAAPRGRGAHRRAHARVGPHRQALVHPRQRLVRRLRQARDHEAALRAGVRHRPRPRAGRGRIRRRFAQRRAAVRLFRQVGRRGQRARVRRAPRGRAEVRHARRGGRGLRRAGRAPARLMEWLAYLGIGALVGFEAGLLGIGGGAVLVPLLVLVFRAHGMSPEHVLHLALGTALAAMMFTSVASMRAHHAHGAVDWKIARAMAPGMLFGSFVAAIVAGWIPTRPLAVLFTAFVFYAATSILLDIKPATTRALPGTGGIFTAGAVIGAVSSLLAAGGAFMTIPFLAWCKVPLRRAIGTAAANGLPIAIAGTAAYVINGVHAQELPPMSLGYVYLPALALVVSTSMLAAPIGARLAHRLPVKRLRTIFALMLYGFALKMLVGLW